MAGYDLLSSASLPGIEVETFASPAAVEREWRQLEASGVGTVFQRFDWVDAYCRHVLPHESSRPAIVLGRIDGEPAFILPLAISRGRPVRVARWIGGNHSSYNFGLWSFEAAAAVGMMARADVEAMLKKALRGADCAVLGWMPRVHDGIAQPLAALAAAPSPTEGYACDLSGGFAAVLTRTDGASRRRRIATKERKMRDIGVFQCGTVRERERAHAALDFFAEQKARWLAEMGRANGFAERGVMDFFRDLVDRSAGMAEPLFEMAELSVGGRIRAVIGTAMHRGRVNACLIAFARDELASHSPGQVLIYRHVEEACERGMTAYDMGVGYEEYKTHWCGVINELTDAHAAFTPLGSAAVAAMRLGRATKDRVRSNAALWRRLKSARASLTRLAPMRKTQ